MRRLLEQATEREGSEVRMPRAMCVFAHPDDETIALGGRMGRFGAAHFVQVTDGAPRNGEDSRIHGFGTVGEYRRARAEELRRAMDEAGIGWGARECMGVADQEASLNLVGVTERLVHLLEVQRPEVVFTHPYEGGHPDHDACAFAVHEAVVTWLLWKGCEEGWAPLIVEAPFYHSAAAWGEGTKQGAVVTGRFAPHPEELESVTYELTEEERGRKKKLLQCFSTQREMLRGFGLERESYRIAPVYDFMAPPCGGKVLYEEFEWGMTASRFCELAEEARRKLRAEAVMA